MSSEAHTIRISRATTGGGNGDPFEAHPSAAPGIREPIAAALSELGQRLSAAATREQAARIIVDLADRLFGWDACYLDLYSVEKRTLEVVLNIDTVNGVKTDVPRGDVPKGELSPMGRRVLETGARLVLRSSEVPMGDTVPFGDVARPSASLMFVPVRSGQSAVGVLSVQSYSPNAYTQADLAALQALGDHCGGALERIRAAEVLAATQNQLQHLLNSSPTMIYSLGINSNAITAAWVSENVLPITGFEVHEALQPNWWIQNLHPDDKAAVQTAHTDLVHRHHLVHEYRFRHKAGHYIWVRDEKRLFCDERGHLVEVVGSLSDITERKRAELALQASEAHYRALFENANDAIIIFDPKNEIILDANTRACTTYGFNRQEFLGLSLKQLTQDVSRGEIEIRDLLAQGAVRNFETVHFRSDGSPIHMLVNASAIEYGGQTAILSIHRDITERKMAEAALRRSEEHFRALIENAMDIISVLEKDGTIRYESPSVERVLGFRPEELVGKNAFEFLHPADRQRILEVFTGAIASGTQFVIDEMRFRHRDGTWRMLEVSGRNLLDDPEIKGLIVNSRDITARRKAEARSAAFSTLGHRLSAAATREAIAAIIVETADHLLGWDSCWLGLYEAERDWLEMILNRDLVDGERRDLPPTNSGPPGPFIRRIIQKGGQQLFRNDAGPPDPALLPFGDVERKSASLMFVPIRDSKGVVGVLSIQCYTPNAYTREDLDTLQALADHAAGAISRRFAEEQIREQASLLNLAHDAILVRDMEHRIIFWSRGAEALYGWKPEEVLGRNCAHLAFPNMAVFERVHAAVLRDGAWSGEMHHVNRTGDEVIVSSRWTLVRDALGQPKSVLVINTDITEKKKLEVQLLRAQRLESIGTLAGGIAHDLNNVLAPILMGTQLLRLKPRDEEERHLLAQIEASAQRGAAVIKQVLTFARGVEGERSLIQPRYLVNEVLKFIRGTFPKNINAECDLPAGLWNITGDATQLHQVLLNLCVNSRDAMPNGGRILLSASNHQVTEADAVRLETRVGAYVLIQVEDTGAGIPREAMEKIFEPFFTTKELGKGTGLGLATALGIVKSHGGFLQIESEEGKGTIARVGIPATVERTDQQNDSEPPRESPRGHGELVLVVDDEQSIREVTHTILARRGYRVLLARNGAEAATIFSHHAQEIRLVLTDLMMPEMDGVTLIQTIRKQAPSVKVVASSGVGDSADLELADANAFLRKPYTAEKLLATLHQVLHAR